MTDLVVRPYEERDRAAVRDVCYLTGYMGEPVDWLWRDTESFADMFTGYYTDEEPSSAFVVEVDGVVSGYLLGCVDSSNAWNPAVVAARHVLRRAIAFRPGTAGVIWRSLSDVVRDIAMRRLDVRQADFSDPAFPAHLHIDLLPPARGAGVGRRLIMTWLDRLRTIGVGGVHLGTFAENTGAIAFFEAMGFTRHGSLILVPGFRTRTGERMHEQVMVQAL